MGAHPSIYRPIKESDEGWYSINDHIRAYVMTRDTRDWGAADESWIIPGAKTIVVELQRDGENLFNLNYTYDGEGKLPGIYKTRGGALAAMRVEMTRRYNRI